MNHIDTLTIDGKTYERVEIPDTDNKDTAIFLGEELKLGNGLDLCSVCPSYEHCCGEALVKNKPCSTHLPNGVDWSDTHLIPTAMYTILLMRVES